MSFGRESEGAALVLRESIPSLLPLPEVLASAQTCRSWYRFSVQDHWEEVAVSAGNVTPDLRRSFWWRCSGAQEVAEQWTARLSEEEGHPLTFEESYRVLTARELRGSQASEIQRDVHRTFPTHPNFCDELPEGRARKEELREVLHAVAAAEPDVGYCQGMNFVAATLLIHLSRASDAFWMLLAIVETCHYRWIYMEGVPLLPLRAHQFSETVKHHLPRLWRVLRDDYLSIDIFAHQCVLTIFAYTIEPQFLAFVYDVFFYLGWKALFRIGTGLLASWESHLLAWAESGSEPLSEALHKCKKQRPPGSSHRSPQEGLKELLKYPLSNQLLRESQANYQLERWELVLRCAAREVLKDHPDDSLPAEAREELHKERCRRDDWRFGFPLPPGVEKSMAIYGGYVLNSDAWQTRNTPPWKRLRRKRRRRRATAAAAAAAATTTSHRNLGLQESRQDQDFDVMQDRQREQGGQRGDGSQDSRGEHGGQHQHLDAVEDCRGAASSSSMQSTADTAHAQDEGGRQIPPSLLPEPWIVGAGPKVVLVADLKQVNEALEKYDIDTRKDVDRLRSSIAETDKELAQVLQETEELRQEVAEAEAELKEWQNYKAALMDSLNAAVMTSPVVLQETSTNGTGRPSTSSSMDATAGPGTSSSSSTTKPRVGVYQDSVVTQCMEKVRKAESDIFEMNKRLQPVFQEMEPVSKLIDDLRRRKARSMDNLNSFVAARAVVRDELLRSHLHRLLPAMDSNSSRKTSDSINTSQILPKESDKPGFSLSSHAEPSTTTEHKTELTTKSAAFQNGSLFPFMSDSESGSEA